SPGVLTSSAQTNLNAALNSNYGSNACNSLVQAIGTAAGFWSDRSRTGLWIDRRTGLIYTSFGLGPANRAWYESVIGSYGNGPGAGNIFFGVYDLPPIFRPVPGRRERIPNDQLPK